MLEDRDRRQLAAIGISESQVEHQLQQIAEGFPFLRLRCAASVGRGIMVPTAEEQQEYIHAWNRYAAEAQGHKVVKFVPASGAASRMFKDLFAFISADYTIPTTESEQAFFSAIHSFAFAEALEAVCLRTAGAGIDALMAQGEYKTIVRCLLTEQGLDYGQLPKGLLLFHRYAGGARTPMEEHLVEAAQYATVDGVARVHFTVSPDHMAQFRQRVDEVVPTYEARYGVKYDVSFSVQAPSTDTIAATEEGQPFRTEEGQLLFRPGGHGALITNLGDLGADVVFIKNIDNVRIISPIIDNSRWKQVLAGVLVTVQAQAYKYLELLDGGQATASDVAAIATFVEQVLCCEREEPLTGEALVAYLRRKLDRPMRVCGVVRNVGEPGGGPFIAYNADGSASPQILESSQIDKSNDEYVRMFREGTHFNPVDLVCGLRDYRGHAYDLSRYVDPSTGFISEKSYGGRRLRALELPGLWNGAMSDWSTIFVEVPIETFTPVKTVTDLLRPEHQK